MELLSTNMKGLLYICSDTAKQSCGMWQANYRGKKVTYSESRFGYVAEFLAYNALNKMKSGEFDPVSDDLLLKHSWRMDDAAKELGLSLGQLIQWMRTGVLNMRELRPPKRDVKGVDRINGYELMKAKKRLAQLKAEE